MAACIRNGIIIYYKPIDNWSGIIVKDDNGVIKEGSTVYKSMSVKFGKKDKKWWKVAESLYAQEYFKLPEGLRELEQKEVDLEFYLIYNKYK